MKNPFENILKSRKEKRARKAKEEEKNDMEGHNELFNISIEGLLAKQAGKSPFECPYTNKSDTEAWLSGYNFKSNSEDKSKEK